MRYNTFIPKGVYIMNKFICITAAAAVLMSCAVSCGSHAVSNSGVKASAETFSNMSTDEIVEEVTGKWQTSYELLNGSEIKGIYHRYIFDENGNGLYYDADGNEHSVRWTITPLGGVKLVYEDMGELTENYDFIGCDLVCIKGGEDDNKDIRETHIVKVTAFTENVE